MDIRPLDVAGLLSERTRTINGSGIRRVFAMAATMKDPINLSIGQPDFDVPEPVKDAAIEAIRAGRNGYTLTMGVPELRDAIKRRLAVELGWDFNRDLDVMVTSGTNGGLLLSILALAGPGDEAIIPDPYFVVYPHMLEIAQARAVRCNTYPDFRMTAERVEPLLNDRTKFVLLNTPGNPSGVTLTSSELRDLVDLCRSRGVLLISDEIYDEFCYDDGRDEGGRFPTPGRYSSDMLLLRGFSKTYGMTGWRLGYAAGPRPLIDEMAKLQQYTFVCAPSMVQHAGIRALDVDMTPHVRHYARKRDMVFEALSPVTEIVRPTGAFYAFPKVPERLGLTGSQFVERAVERNLLVIPGSAFSDRDTHLRLSYAVDDQTLKRGLDVLVDLLRG